MSIVAKLWDGLRASYTKLVVAELNNYGACYVCVLACYICMHCCGGERDAKHARALASTTARRRGAAFWVALSPFMWQRGRLTLTSPCPQTPNHVRVYTGLRYQDLFLEDDTTTKAIHMLSPEEQVAR